MGRITESFTGRDFDSNISALNTLIVQRFPGSWTDFFPGSLGNVIKELIAHDFDILSYMLDIRARESYLTTARLRESVIHIANGLGFKIGAAVGSSVDVNIELAGTLSEPVIIPKLSTVSSTGGVVFEFADEAVIPAGSLTPEVVVIAASPTILMSLPTSSVTVTVSSRLPDQIRVGHHIKPSISSDAFQISFISEDRLSMSIAIAFTGTSIVSSQFSTVNRQVTLVQGSTSSKAYISDGSINQTLTSEFTDILSGTVTVSVNGLFWKEVESVVQELDESIYSVRLDENDAPIIRFGDNVTGKIPPLNAEIIVSARSGVGKAGNVGRNAINTYVSGDFGFSEVQVSVSNPLTAASGGADRPTIEEIKSQIPKYLKTGDSAITLEDYNNFANGFSDILYGKVAKAVAELGTNFVPFELNLVKVYIWSLDENGALTTPSDGLRGVLKTFLDERKMVGTEIFVLDGIIKNVNLVVRIDKDITINPVNIETDIRTAIADLFAGISVEPGKPLHLSKVYEAIENVEGVNNVFVDDSDFVQGDLEVTKFEVLSLASLTILVLPNAPSFLSLPSTSADGSVVLSWDFVPEAIDYEVQIATSSSFIGSTIVTTTASTVHLLTGLTNGTYYFRVRARNNAGFSDFTDGNNALQVVIA